MDRPMRLCGHGENECTVGPDGTVRSCCGAWDETEFNTARNTGQYCSGCFAKYHCLGGCGAGAQSRSAPQPGSARCHLARELLVDELLGRIAAAGGVSWHEVARPARIEQPLAASGEVG